MFVLEPPYRVAKLLSSVRYAPIPIGALVCACCPNSLESLVELLGVLRTDPWVVPTVIVPRDQLRFVQPLIGSMPPLHDRVVPVTAPAPQARLPAAEVVGAVRLRAKPDGRVLAEYVSSRLEAPLLTSPLECQFREALQGASAPTDRSVATYCRLFRRYGAFTARDWRAIARLASYLAHQPKVADNGQGRMVRYSHRYLGTSLYTATTLLGWEWVIEKALLRANYHLAMTGNHRWQTQTPKPRVVSRRARIAL